MKLGEALIEAGLITRQQLGLALERQSVLGGRIDTNIVELRFLSEERLTAFLGKILRLPVVAAEALSSIPEEVIRVIGKDMADNYRIIPFALERQRLHIAMLNPRSLKDIDNLRFTTGYEIVPYVITESRLLFVLEKYYGIKRETRYISVKDRFEPDSNAADISGKIERMSGEPLFSGKDEGEPRMQKKIAPYPNAHKAVETAGSGLLEALVLNAIYSAKLFYAQQGLAVDDDAIEDQVIADWVRLSAKLRQNGALLFKA